MAIRLLDELARPAGRRCARFRLTGAALAAGLLLAIAPGVQAAKGDDVVYSFDVQLAPVCLEGSFPLRITTGAVDALGTLAVETGPTGKISGTLTFGSAVYTVSGSVSYGAAKSKLTLAAKSGKDHIDLSGTLASGQFTGTAKSKGAVAPGKNLFVLDVSTSPPQMATILIRLHEGNKTAVTGTGEVRSCGDSLPLKVTGRTSKFTLAAGKKFSFKAKQVVADFSWTSHGFGATTAGEALELAPLPPPTAFAYSTPVAEYETEAAITPNVPVGSSNPFGTYAISGSLPAGLAFDAATGAISGTPTAIAGSASYTVTAENHAGEQTATVQIATRIARAKSFAAETRPIDDAGKRHFLTRTRFGVTLAEKASLDAQGVDSYLDAMLVFPSGTAQETAAFNTELVNATDPPGQAGQFPNQSQVARWQTNLLLNGSNPFQENVAFFWHDHFGVSSAGFDGNTGFMVPHIDLLRHEGNGKLRSFLLKVARDPAMLVFLDGILNTRSAPNENFGREFWELFTLGVDNVYTQADIIEASKAWSGYRQRFNSATNLNEVTFDTNRHHTGTKTILGVTIPGQNVTDDFQAVVDITLDHTTVDGRHPVAEFVTKKFFEHFCYDDPPDALVRQMGDFLHAQDYDMTVFFRALLRSEAFFSPASRKTKVKNPVEYGIGFIRTTGLVLRVSDLDTRLTTLGQRPSQPPTVNGWPLGELWLSSQGLADRTNLVYTSVEDTSRQATAGINVANILPVDRSPASIVDHLAGLMDIELSAADKTEFVTYLDTVRQSSNGAIVASPFTGSQAQIDERVRGLLLILSQHPDYHVR